MDEDISMAGPAFGLAPAFEEQPKPQPNAPQHQPAVPGPGRKQLQVFFSWVASSFEYSPFETFSENRDLVFVQDCTGSQGTYISSATRNIEAICAHIFESGRLQSPEDLRVGLVAFRDHPPQDHTYVTKNFGFSSDTSQVRKYLSTLYASGGGDGPEAVTAALADALNMDWRLYATKMVVLIADAPPHGIGEYGDGTLFALLFPPYVSDRLLLIGFDDGSPDGNDPLQIARQMASKGITLVSIVTIGNVRVFDNSAGSFLLLVNLPLVDIRYIAILLALCLIF